MKYKVPYQGGGGRGGGSKREEYRNPTHWGTPETPETGERGRYVYMHGAIDSVKYKHTFKC